MRMRRRFLLALLAVCFVIIAAPLHAPAAEDGAGKKAGGKGRPNILFIMSDDHGYQALGCYGSVVNKTPNLDRIAKGGMRFDRCFVTNSICGPSRAVILTGKYSHLNGFVRNGNTFNGAQQTVAKLLQQAGYQTAMIGKWHLKSEPTGFDDYHVLIGQGPYYNPPMRTPDGVVRHTGYTTDVITDEALDWLQNKRDSDRPFLLMYQHKAPHRNWQPGPEHLTMYDDVTIPEPDTLFDDYRGRGTAAKQQEMTIARHLNPNDLKLVKQRGLTKEQEEAWNKAYAPKNKAFEEANLEGKDLVRWKYQRYAKDYLRCIASVDDNVGRVLDYLDESGLAENTVVIYTSDQGWYLGEHGWFDKRWMYEESFRTPLMICWPGVTEPGSVNSNLTMNLDFPEMFLEIAGAEIPDDMQGRSLVPLLQGKDPDDWRKSVYYHYYEFPGAHSVRKHLGVRTDRYKLIHFYDIGEWELYDLEKDPQELQSVYDDPEYQSVVEDMKQELERLKKLYNDDGSVVDFGAERARNVKLKLVERFDSNSVQELSAGATVAAGRDGKALQLPGKGAALSLERSNRLDPSYKPITLGGWVNPQQPDGVILAQGGESAGYSLFLRDGVPQLAVRRSGQLAVAEAKRALATNEWSHVAAILDKQGNARFFINGEPADPAENPSQKKKSSASQAELGFVNRLPADSLTLGADTGSLVADYDHPLPFQGKLQDIRLYWGELDAQQMKAWAQ